MRNGCVKIHPAVVNMMDGDFDGDMLHLAIPVSEAGINDLRKMDAIEFICNHPSEFRPGKEFAKYREAEWSRDSAILKYQVEQIRRKSTNGMSISYKDLLDKNKEGYFTNTSVNRENLAQFSNGISQSNVFSIGNSNLVRGGTISDAVKDYRTIKSFVPKSGGLTNSLMALAISKFKDRVNIEGSTAMSLIHTIAHAKHILCQDGLSAKHGSNSMDNADKLFAGFYRTFVNVLETEKDYRNAMADVGLHTADIDAIIEIYWTNDPENINDMLKVLAPHYLLTRRSASFASLEDVVTNYKTDSSLQKDFIEQLIEPGEIYEPIEHTDNVRRCINKIPRQDTERREPLRISRKS